jgi:nitrogen-specific signal transduction histidine kinase
VEIRVEDNGPGVPPSHGEKIFEPYFTTKSDGTGLGLAIVKKIVLQHGGTITLKRSPSLGGAAFVIQLPPARNVHVAVLDTQDVPPAQPEGDAPIERVSGSGGSDSAEVEGR